MASLLTQLAVVREPVPIGPAASAPVLTFNAMELALDHDAMQTVAQYGKPPGTPVEHLRRPVARVAVGPVHDVLVRSGSAELRWPIGTHPIWRPRPARGRVVLA